MLEVRAKAASPRRTMETGPSPVSQVNVGPGSEGNQGTATAVPADAASQIRHASAVAGKRDPGWCTATFPINPVRLR